MCEDDENDNRKCGMWDEDEGKKEEENEGERGQHPTCSHLL